MQPVLREMAEAKPAEAEVQGLGADDARGVGRIDCGEVPHDASGAC